MLEFLEVQENKLEFFKQPLYIIKKMSIRSLQIADWTEYDQKKPSEFNSYLPSLVQA